MGHKSVLMMNLLLFRFWQVGNISLHALQMKIFIRLGAANFQIAIQAYFGILLVDHAANYLKIY